MQLPKQKLEPFDPAAWLARWSANGGAWVGSRLLIPRPDPALKRMIRDLDTHEVFALARHLGADCEFVE